MLNNALINLKTRERVAFNFRNQLNSKQILLKFLILIQCISKLRTAEQFDPLEQGLCSDYLIENLISSSVSTFRQLWFTSEKIADLNRNKLTFITYLDTWLRRDGTLNLNEKLQTIDCSDFGRFKIICRYELEFLRLRHMIFDGIFMYLFLQNNNNQMWRVIVIEVNSGKLLLFDSFKNCAKKRKNQLKFYERFFCIISHHMDLNFIKSFLMMNIDMKAKLEESSFEIWCFFKNKTMKKLRFNDRDGNYQLINLGLNSYSDISLSSIQFVTDQFLSLNSSFNLFNHQKQRRSIDEDSNEKCNTINNDSINSNLINLHLNHSSLRLKRSIHHHYHFPSNVPHRKN